MSKMPSLEAVSDNKEPFDGEMLEVVEKISNLLLTLKQMNECEKNSKKSRNLLMACKTNDHNLIMEHMSKGIRPDVKDETGATCLMWSACFNNCSSVNYLLNVGSDINAKTNIGGNALMCAARNNGTEVASLLISRGAEINNQMNDGTTALYLASFAGNVNLVLLLIYHGAKVNMSDKYGGTPLSIAAYNGHKQAVKILLDCGAKKGTFEDNFRKTGYNRIKNHLEICQILGLA